MGGLFFNDSLTIDAFHCIKCKEILKPPIVLTPKGNMCLHHESQKGDPCDYEKEPERLRNIPLEQIMEHITCACRYKESGCEEIVKLYKISEHEESCKFKAFTCLLAGCEWSGLESDYVYHLHEHTDFIDRGSDGMFQLQCSTEGTDNVCILRTVSGLSLLHVKVLKDKLICAIYDIENRYMESYKIRMSHLTLFRSKIENEHICQIVDSLNQLINFESVVGTEIKFDNLNPVNNKDVRVCLKHVFNGEIISSEMKDKSKYEGHLELLEEMKIRLPCRNASLGCREQHFPESQHDNISCYYNKWRCWIDIDCQFEGLFINLVDHIQNNHESIRHNETTVALNLSSHKIAFIVYGNIFILKYYLQDPDWMKWQVFQLTSRSAKASRNFGVEVSINSSVGNWKSFYYKDVFKKYSFNIDRCELLIKSSVLKTLLPQCTEATVRIIEMKK